MTLDVSAYDRAEERARHVACNRVIEAAGTATFARRGYPSRAVTDRDVVRYVDALHELGAEQTYRAELGGLTPREFELFQRVCREVATSTECRFGRPVVPRGALIRAFVAFRHIHWISDPATTTVLEIGPGSGYLGALLGLAGYGYVAHDIAQGFYLAQNMLWAGLFGGRMIELADDARELKDIPEVTPGTVVHVPWWKFYLPDARDLRLRVDVVTVNHALCEMHRSAFGYVLELGRRILAGPGEPKYFLAEGPGADDLRNHVQMREGFATYGYVSVYDKFPVDIFAPASLGEALYEPAGPEAERVFRVAARIARGTAALAESGRVSYEEAVAFLRSLTGGRDVLTDDERFLRFAYGADHW